MNNPLVSIIITTHKGSESIDKCVESVLLQEYPNKEVIIVDDNGIGTKDQIETEIALKRFIEKKQIVYCPHQINKNGSAARNTGFSLSHGSIIGFLDDDDIYLPEKIQKSVDVLCSLDDSWGAVYTDAIQDMGDDKRYKTASKQRGNILFASLCHTIFMNPSTLLIKRPIIEKLRGYDDSYARHQDFEFNARLSQVCKIEHIAMLGSVYNCQVHRHYNKDRAIEYRTYYINKMSPIIAKLPIWKQKVVVCKNAIEIHGIGLSKYSQCLELSKSWGYNINIFNYMIALFYSIKQRYSITKL